MEGEFQTSFIPKKPFLGDRGLHIQPVSVFVFISTIVFFASLVGAGAVYIYESGLTRNLEVTKNEFVATRQEVDDNFIISMQALDRRINAAESVLNNHIVVSPIFKILEEATLQSVQFTKFSQSITGNGSGAVITIQMSGKAVNYKEVALQYDQLLAHKEFKNPIFSDLGLDTSGNVLFNLTFTVDPNFVLYGKILSQTQANTTTATNNFSGETSFGSDATLVPNEQL